MPTKIFTLINVVLLFSFFGCEILDPANPDNDPLVGTWNMTIQTKTHSSGVIDTVIASDWFGNQYEFKSDKTLGVTAKFFGASLPLTGTWSATADSITIGITGGESQAWAYAIAGTELALTISEPEGSGSLITVEKYAKQ
jgi:hypothetical protein